MYYLPCAGITLVRFYGSDLSLPATGIPATGSTPRNLKISLAKETAKIGTKNFYQSVTFLFPRSSHPKPLLMARIFFLLYLVVAAGFSSFAQEKVIKDANVEKRTVSGFHTIKVEDGIDLYLTQDATEAVAVSASQTEYRDKILTTVEDGVLRIHFDGNYFSVLSWRNRQLKAYVSVKTLKELKASGGSDVYISSGLKSEDFKMSISGGSDFNGSITCTNLEVHASGGSDTKISGKVVNLKISASGGSDFIGYDLVAENVFVSASGGSDARITATNELGVEASGGSDVDYKGNAVIKYKSSSGGSSVTKRN